MATGRRSIHIADNLHNRGRPSWLFNAPKPKRQYSAFLKLFCWVRNRASPTAEISPLLREHAELYKTRHDCAASGCDTVKINVAGQIFETQLKTLRRYPESLLGDPVKSNKHWDNERKEYFFDRHRPSFEAILNFYQTGGRLHRPMEVPDEIFQDEIKFFQLGDEVLEEYRDGEGYLHDYIPAMPESGCRRFFWHLFAGWNSSIIARCMGIWSMFVTALSVVLVCVETLPKYHKKGCDGAVVIDEGILSELASLFLVETMCVLWFCIELTMRFHTDPNKKEFFKKIINIMDAVTIFPYAGTVVEWHFCSQCLVGNVKNYIIVFKLLKFLRVMRVFKFCRYFLGLRILLVTIRKSSAELCLYIFFILSLVVIFSSGIYYAEISNNYNVPKFQNIPEAFWWAVVSLTTVGYGDYVPHSGPGKVVGTLCIVTGILVVALPVPILVANFTKYYRHQTGKLLR